MRQRPARAGPEIAGQRVGPQYQSGQWAATERRESPIRARFLYLGLPLDQVVELTPAAPARAIHEDRSLGTLQPGAAADVTVLSLVEGPVELAETMGEQVNAPRRLVPTAVVRAGRRITLQSRRSGAEG